MNLRTAQTPLEAGANCIPGAGSADGMDTETLYAYLKDNDGVLKWCVLDRKYKLKPVRRTGIPKDNGRKHMLGIFTAVDRVIQQAVPQKLTYTDVFFCCTA